MKSIEHDTLYTNVALTDDGDVWWEGKDGPPPKHAIDWRGNDWTPDSKEKAAHPNSRFATPMRNNPALDPNVEKGEGVPISAIIFGGRRSDTVPLVYEAFDWTHGVYLGATMASETTAAATGAVGQIRRDPMAMLPFCGYNIGDYFRHWIGIGKRLTNPPLIFNVNWFRKGANGKFLWPGFGENMRVLKWMIDRCEQNGGAVKSPVGWLPSPHDLDLDGLNIDHTSVADLLESITRNGKKNLHAHKTFSTRSAAWFRRNCRRNARRGSGVSLNTRRRWGVSSGVRNPVTGVIDHIRYPVCRNLRTSSSASFDEAHLCGRNLRSLDWQRIFPSGSKVASTEHLRAAIAKDHIEIRGARQNISKGIDVDLPLEIDVVTGPSGSGQIQSGIRDYLRRWPATLRRNVQPIHAAIFSTAWTSRAWTTSAVSLLRLPSSKRIQSKARVRLSAP
jgi:hypothetical protein